MKPAITALLVSVFLSACGADGEPRSPDVNVSTTIGVNSASGGYTDTDISIHFPLN
ncbi:hypothetical protein [Celeribacter litoreus]|uniref:hypothetical protein n=1 Tax=Celeribacter litoreus TaxID=2876714 RepID=UPI001CCEED2B|nr:hypothetical protein [Celeribacter litoreus]MCA0044336.1 hypothetical protein [Celeribacter litoreus]